jgi:hypothetical protein
MTVVVPRAKLAAILGMMGSRHDGEVLAAARTAERMRREAGVSWQELLVDTGVAELPAAEREAAADWRNLCAQLQRRAGDLRPWERRFVASLPNFPRLSAKQRGVLASIAERVRTRGQEAGA